MRPQNSQHLRACLVLAGATTICAFLVSTAIGMVLLTVTATLFATELDRRGGLIAVRLVRLASRLLPRSIRQDSADEWVDHIRREGEEGMLPVLGALSIAFFAAPRIALRRRTPQIFAELFLASVFAMIYTVGLDSRGLKGELLTLSKACLSLPLMPLQVLLVLVRRPLPPSAVLTAGLAAIALSLITGPWTSAMSFDLFGAFALTSAAAVLLKMLPDRVSEWCRGAMTPTRARSLAGLIQPASK